MKLLGDFDDLDIAEWLRGAIAAFVSGGASAVTSGITVSAIDNKDYNLGEGSGKLLVLMTTMFLVNGFMGLMFFLRQKPVPDHKVVERTVERTIQKPEGVQVIETVKETHTEPTEPRP